jgi:hypothetical protein
LVTIDIAMIGAAGFTRLSKHKGNTVFTTSLYKIDRLIEKKTSLLEETLEQLVERQLPACYTDYKDIFSKAVSDQLAPYWLYDYKIQLEGENNLGFSPLYNYSLEELQAIKKYITENLQKGFIASSSTLYTAPILFARKGNSSLQFCIDFRKLNLITQKNRYPLPLIDKTLACLGKARIFTKLDIRQAFYRIQIHPDSEDLTTFQTQYRTYKIKVVPFGLTNSPATYQYYINNVLFDYLDDFCTAYLDDILIYSENKLEYKAVIQDWQPPTTVKGVQSFLGFCNFYRCFIKEYRRIARSLNRLTRKGTPFIFDKACQEAF